MRAGRILAAAAVVLATASVARTDIVLRGVEHYDVTASHSTGVLWEFSTADVVSGGYIDNAYVHDDAILRVRRPSGSALYRAWVYDAGQVAVSSGVVSRLDAWGTGSVDVDGGSVGDVYAYETSSLSISGGSVWWVSASETSSVDISGGSVGLRLNAHDTSTVDISGGSVPSLGAYGRSTVTLHGHGFLATGGLSLVEYDIVNGVPQYEVIGTGALTGTWFDGSLWTLQIEANDLGATILAVPEPASLSLLALLALSLPKRGALAASRRRRLATWVRARTLW